MSMAWSNGSDGLPRSNCDKLAQVLQETVEQAKELDQIKHACQQTPRPKARENGAVAGIVLAPGQRALPPNLV